MTNRVLKELSTYVLEVGESITGDEGSVYIIKNKDTEVIETETRILPQAYGYLEQLQAALDATMDMQADVPLSPVFNLDSYKH